MFTMFEVSSSKNHISFLLIVLTLLAVPVSINLLPQVRLIKQHYIICQLNEARKRGDVNSATKLYKEVIEISNEIIGLSPLGNRVYETLDDADTISLSGNLPEARSRYLKAIALGRETSQINAPDAAYAMNRYALALENFGRYSEAQVLLELAEVLRLNIDSKNYTDMFLTNNLGNLLLLNGDYEHAALRFKETIHLHQSIVGKENLNSGATCKLITALTKLSKYSEVRTLVAPYLSSKFKLHQEDPIGSAVVENAFAKACAKEGDYVSARDNYLLALQTICDNKIRIPTPIHVSLEDKLCPVPTAGDIEKALLSLEQSSN